MPENQNQESQAQESENQNKEGEGSNKEANAAAEAVAAAEAAKAAGGNKEGNKSADDAAAAAAAKEKNPHGVKDNGQKLDLLAGKYKNTDELVKGYQDLTKKLTESGKLAPDKYDLKLPAGLEVKADDPALKSFTELAKKANLSNETYNEIVKLQAEFGKKIDDDYKAAAEATAAAEMEKLGKGGPALIKGLEKFFGANMPAAQFEQIRKIAVSYDGVKTLELLREKMKNTNPPADADQNGGTGATPAEADAALAKATAAQQKGEAGWEILRKEAERMFEEAYPEDANKN